jgi:hypothetical protein
MDRSMKRRPEHLTLLAFVWVIVLLCKFYSPFGLQKGHEAISRPYFFMATYGYLAVVYLALDRRKWWFSVPAIAGFLLLTLSNLRDGEIWKIGTSALLVGMTIGYHFVAFRHAASATKDSGQEEPIPATTYTLHIPPSVRALVLFVLGGIALGTILFPIVLALSYLTKAHLSEGLMIIFGATSTANLLMLVDLRHVAKAIARNGKSFTSSEMEGKQVLRTSMLLPGYPGGMQVEGIPGADPRYLLPTTEEAPPRWPAADE